MEFGHLKQLHCTMTILKTQHFGIASKDSDEMSNSAGPDQTAPLGAV